MGVRSGRAAGINSAPSRSLSRNAGGAKTRIPSIDRGDEGLPGSRVDDGENE